MAYKQNGQVFISDDAVFGTAAGTSTFGGAELLHTIDNPNADQITNIQDLFGYSVGISGNRAIVGAYGEDLIYSDSGIAYIFDVNTGALLHTLNNPNSDQSTNQGDQFGRSVAISGNRAIVSAINEDVPYLSSGSVYIFDVESGALLHTINNPNSDQSTNQYDHFGWQGLAISDNRAIVAAWNEDVPYSGSGSVYIFDVNTGTLLHTIDNPNSDQSTNTDDRFGWSVGISGNRAIVGAVYEDVPYDRSGSVYIFDVNTGALLHTIDDPNRDNLSNITDFFGYAVAIDGNRAIAGARNEDVPYAASGSAYIFNASTGALLHTIDNPNSDQSTNTLDFFGSSVAISGNRAIVGATDEDVPYDRSGSVYIFDVESGALLYTIDNPNSDQSTNIADYFGISVGISGNRAIAGAYLEDASTAEGGSVYIFSVDPELDSSQIEEVEFSNGTSFNFLSDGLFQVAHNSTTLLHTIDNPNSDQSSNTYDLFGEAVAISGNRAIVGARYEDVPYTDSGSVYIFDVNTGALLHTIDSPNADQGTGEDWFGYSVAIEGNRAIVGAEIENVSPGTFSGVVYIFNVETGALLHTINNPDTAANGVTGDFFGASVAISGNRVIVGTPQEDVPYGNSGSAYILDVNTGSVLHRIDNPNSDQSTTQQDYFGISVGISGSRAIVGAYREDVPYQDSGSAYIFDVESGALLHTLDNPNSKQDIQISDEFGKAVAISGNRAIVGAKFEDAPYTDSGSVYIFDVTSGALLHTIDNPNADQSTNQGDYFGISVAIDGNRAIVGAQFEDAPYSASGSAYIFDVTSGALLYTINNPVNSFNAGLFGTSVAISGNRVIGGAPEADVPYAESGSAYIFTVDSETYLENIFQKEGLV